MLIEVFIAYFIGIVLAKANTILIPIVLLTVGGIEYVFFERHWKHALLIVIAALANLMALQQPVARAGAMIGEKPQQRERNAIFSAVSQRIDSLHLTPDTQALTHGLLLGDRTTISRTRQQMVRQAGMSHILAVSGMHIGIIYLFLFVLFYPIYLLGLLKLHKLLIAAAIWLYVLTIGCPLSAVRAALMITLTIVADLSERDTNGKNILASAALIMLLYDPRQLWDVGFQLSFLAALGIVLSKPLLENSNKLTQLLVVTLTAQIATAPIVAYYFHIVPLFGWLQGFAVVPLLPILIFSMTGSLLFPTVPILKHLVEWLADWLYLVAENTTAIETMCLGGKLMWYPDLLETCVLETLVIFSLIVLAQRRKHTAGSKYVLAT